MNVQKIAIEKLSAAKYNPRKDLKPGDSEFEKLRRSIEEFGYVEPIIWNKRTGNIVGGHQRAKVLKHLGHSEVDCVVLDIDDTKEKALNIALNKISGEWDNEKLSELIQDLELSSFDISLTGFETSELSQIADEYNDEVQEDDYEIEAQEETVCKLGDVWQLGKHRLVCGDSTNEEDLKKLMNGELANLVVTDPPYNVDYGSKADAINKYGYGFSDRTIKNDNMSEIAFIDFLTKAFRCMHDSLKAGGAYYVWHASTTVKEFEMALQANGLKTRQQLIWVKNSIVLGRQDWQWKHEPCLYGWKEGAAHYFIDDRTQTTVHEEEIDFKKLTKDDAIKMLKEVLSDKISTTIINEDKPSRSAEHPTMKPIKLLARLIKNSSRHNEIVLDTFGGSGSTLIACEQLNRVCYTMELDPKYCDVIINRYEKFTGDKAQKIN